MVRSILDQILEQIKTLDSDELQQVNRAVQERLIPEEEVRKRQAFHQALIAFGLVKQIKTPPSVNATKRQLVQVQGKPVSQAIIEERR